MLFCFDSRDHPYILINPRTYIEFYQPYNNLIFNTLLAILSTCVDSFIFVWVRTLPHYGKSEVGVFDFGLIHYLRLHTVHSCRLNIITRTKTRFIIWHYKHAKSNTHNKNVVMSSHFKSMRFRDHFGASYIFKGDIKGNRWIITLMLSHP